MKKFALPEKIMCDGTDAGKFAPLPVGGGEAKLFIEESGSRHMVLRIEVPSSPEYGYLRVHFFYGIPEFEVEYHAVDAKSTPVEFISRRRYALDVKRSKEVCRYRFGFGMARVEAAPPLTAVLPRWHLERTGIIPAENLLPQELRDIEKTLLKQIASTPDKFAPGMLLEAFLRTGELKLFAMTVKGEKGIKSARHRNILRAHGVKCEVLEEIAPAETLPGHGVVSTAALIKFLNGKTGQSRDFIRLLDILCSGFDPVSGSWYDRIDILNGAASTEYVPFALRLQALKLVLENSLSNFGGKFDGIAACGLERLAVDAPGGGAVRGYDIFTVLALAGEFYRRHPQLADEFSGEEFLVRRSAINPAAVKLKIRNGFSAKAVPRDSDASLRLSGFAAGGGITFAAKDGEVLPGYFAGKDNIYQVKLPKSGAEMMYRSHKASEIGVFPLPGYEFRFRIAGMGAELPQAQLCGFALYPAPGVKSFKIRLLPADPNESCLVVLISPEGRRFRQMVCGVACYTAAGTAPLEFPVTEAGAWQMFIHAPDGGVVVASDDVELVIKRPDLH